MAPLLLADECVKCHAEQGYRVGDVRGGISVSIPAGDFIARLGAARRDQIASHTAVWAVVSLMLLFYLRQYRRQWDSLKTLTGTLEERVAERTAKLEDEIVSPLRSRSGRRQAFGLEADEGEHESPSPASASCATATTSVILTRMPWWCRVTRIFRRA